MKVFLKITSIFISLLLSCNSLASSLAEEAKNREINSTCYNYLSQIEASYELSGLNITFAHPESPSSYPSLHISTQKYNNGSSSFSATLTPDGDYCYLSTIMITTINNQSCSEVAEIKTSSDENLQASSYAEGNYIILTPQDKTFQTILTSSGDYGYTISETRMMWPGR